MDKHDCPTPRRHTFNEGEYPWLKPPLDQWSIGSMNHYNLKGKKCLFVLMTKGKHHIKAEGNNERKVWAKLWSDSVRIDCWDQ